MNVGKVQKTITGFFSSDKLVQKSVGTQLNMYEKKILKKKLSPNSRILDVACGWGRVSIPLARKGHFVVGVDISPYMIKIAKQKAKKENLKNVRFYCKDILKFNFKKKFFDFILIFESSLEHIPSNKKREKILMKLCKLLKPGGLLITSFHPYFFPFKEFLRLQIQNIRNLINKKYEMNDIIINNLYTHFFTHFEIERLFKKSGFKKIQAVPINLLYKKKNKFKSPKIYNFFKMFIYSFWIFKKLESKKS